jgi:hypothetical protein
MTSIIEWTKDCIDITLDDAVTMALGSNVNYLVGNNAKDRNLWGIVCATIRNADYDVILSDHERELLKSLTRPGRSLIGPPRLGDGMPPVYTSVSATIGKTGYELSTIGFINVEGRGVEDLTFKAEELVGADPALVAQKVQAYLNEQAMEYPNKHIH